MANKITNAKLFQVPEGDRAPVWQDEALCALPQNKDLAPAFFSADPLLKAAAKNLCFSCPVRKECVKGALEAKIIWGIWGGRDDNELRRTLSLNSAGNEVRRGRYPQCPHCSARTSKLRVEVVDLPEGGRWTTAKEVHCTVCDFFWRSRTSANAVASYFVEREDKKAKKLKKIELEQLRPTRAGRSPRQSPKSESPA